MQAYIISMKPDLRLAAAISVQGSLHCSRAGLLIAGSKIRQPVKCRLAVETLCVPCCNVTERTWHLVVSESGSLPKAAYHSLQVLLLNMRSISMLCTHLVAHHNKHDCHY